MGELLASPKLEFVRKNVWFWYVPNWIHCLYQQSTVRHNASITFSCIKNISCSTWNLGILEASFNIRTCVEYVPVDNAISRKSNWEMHVCPAGCCIPTEVSWMPRALWKMHSSLLHQDQYFLFPSLPLGHSVNTEFHCP